jgi:hypothetical protein
VRLDLEVVLLHARQLRHDRDAVRAGVDIHDWKPAAGRRAVGVRKALHLILEPAQLAEGVRAAEEAEGAQGGHRSFLLDQDRRPRLQARHRHALTFII